MSYHLNPLTIGSYAVSESVMLEGVPHVTRRAMGEFLEYSNARKAIGTLIDRNPYIESYSSVLNMRTQDGRNIATRVYHPVGFMAVVLSSDQPKAKLVKEAVANLVYEYSRRDKISPGLEMQLRYQKLTIVNRLDSVKTQFARRALITSLTEVCEQLGEPVPDVGLIGRLVTHG